MIQTGFQDFRFLDVHGEACHRSESMLHVAWTFVRGCDSLAAPTYGYISLRHAGFIVSHVVVFRHIPLARHVPILDYSLAIMLLLNISSLVLSNQIRNRTNTFHSSLVTPAVHEGLCTGTSTAYRASRPVAFGVVWSEMRKQGAVWIQCYLRTFVTLYFYV